MKYRIIGTTIPAVEIKFDAPGETMYTQSGGMSWMSEGISMSTNTRGGFMKGLGRMFSGEYPKDAEFFPDNKFLVSLNHESNTMTFFHIDLEHGTMIMNGPAMKVNMPNCILFHKLG